MARQRTVAPTVAAFADRFEGLVANMEQVIQGKRDTVRLALVCLLAEGHLEIGRASCRERV